MRSKNKLLNGLIRSQQQWVVSKKDKTVLCFILAFEIPSLHAPLCCLCKGQTLFLPKSLQESQQNLSQAWQPIYIIHRFLAKLLKLIRWQTFILAALINKRTRFPGGGNVSKYSSFQRKKFFKMSEDVLKFQSNGPQLQLQYRHSYSFLLRHFSLQEELSLSESGFQTTSCCIGRCASSRQEQE